jgi:MHS family shikimate/dehydroshikimate transporter-like MFS transporter
MNPPSSRRALIKAVIASTIGTTIEWYDFFLYGTAATLVFPALFFPKADPFTGKLLAFGTFTIGFLARPLGGVIFGYLGDRVGRKSTLVATLLLMGVSTLLIGFLPTYDQLGLWAPVILTLLRFLQGLGVGGEWGGAILMALETSRRGRRGFYASWPQTGVPLGLLSSTAVVALCQSWLGPEDFRLWGWRVPFFLSGVLIVVGMIIRLRILESPLFVALQEQNKVAEAPLGDTLRRHGREILLAAGTRIVENACFYLFTVAAIAYGRDVLKVPEGLMLLAVNIAAAVEVVVIPIYGMFSDRLTRRHTYMAGCLFLMLFAWPYYALLDTRQPGLIVLAVIVSLAGGHAILYSVQASLIPELFDTRVRCTGASISYQLASPFAGGLAPLIATVLIEGFPGQYWPLALYIILMGALSLACVQRLAETSRKALT